MSEKFTDLVKSLFEGVKEENMIHLPLISSYNSNYYCFNGYLLYGESDDDNFTAWYWVRGDRVDAIGGSYCTDGGRILIGSQFT